MKRFSILSIIALCVISSKIVAQYQPASTTIELVFVDHLKAGLIEQDVFVEKEVGSGEVYRLLPTEREKYLNAEVFTSKKGHHHDPFDKLKVGPYKKGRSLGITLQEWLYASGAASYTCEDGWGTFKAQFTNLVPNATYTMWHFFMPAPPTVPFTGTLDLPMGDREGKQSVFKTDAEGNASLNESFEHCLQLGGSQLMSGMAIALHSDSNTYGSEPGDFGKLAHVHLFAMLPKEDEVKKY